MHLERSYYSKYIGTNQPWVLHPFLKRRPFHSIKSCPTWLFLPFCHLRFGTKENNEMLQSFPSLSIVHFATQIYGLLFLAFQNMLPLLFKKFPILSEFCKCQLQLKSAFTLGCLIQGGGMRTPQKN